MFFAQPRAKKRPTVERPFYRKKRKTQIEEIEFKPDDREEYLTGFRKRKQQRVKLAQAEAAKKAREARNESRRKLREERRQQFEEHVKSVSQLLKESQTAGDIEDQVIEGDMEWDGTDGAPAVGEFEDQEQEYVDDDRFTTVTIESVAVTRDGLLKPAEEEAEEEERERHRRQCEEEDARRLREQSAKKLPPQKPKKKFRYETKQERQKTLQKQKERKTKK
jgi:ribosomal RNA-processing protein 17